MSLRVVSQGWVGFNGEIEVEGVKALGSDGLQNFHWEMLVYLSRASTSLNAVSVQVWVSVSFAC